MDFTSLFLQLPVPQTPIDFRLPESLNDYIQPSYTHINRNVYLTKRKPLEEDSSMQCNCRPSSSPHSNISCNKDCLCAILFSSCSSTCGCGKTCVNKPFHQRPLKMLQVSKTEKCGWGVKAAENINAGEFVIEYVGEIINRKTCHERVMKMEERGETNFYLCEVSRNMVIDSTERGNISRFINHSCCPNSELQKWQNDGEIRVAVFAKTDIKKGEFLTYDYQFKQFGRDKKCYCGSADCRGVLGLKPKPKCVEQMVRILWPLDNKFYRGRIVDYDPATQMHTVCYDDGDIEELFMDNETWEFDNGTQQ